MGEFGIQNSGLADPAVPMRPLGLAPVLIDQVHDRLLAAIVEGILPPGHRIRQEELADQLGVSRQPVSHALQLLKRQGLLEESGKRGLVVAGVDPARVLALYQVRGALDALAAGLAASRVAAGAVSPGERQDAEQALAAGQALTDSAGVAEFIAADVAFHTALYRLSGNPAIEETVATQWPHLKRSMGVVLADGPGRPAIWAEHASILDAILSGDAPVAAEAARRHADRAGQETARRLSRRPAA